MSLRSNATGAPSGALSPVRRAHPFRYLKWTREQDIEIDMTNSTLQPPDVRFHRPNDGPYLSELVTRAGMSVNRIADLIGVSSRTLRYALKGEAALPYTAQYALEALAHHQSQQEPFMRLVKYGEPEHVPAPRIGTIWYSREERPITAADAGKMIVARDRIGSPIFGTIHADDFGPIIRHNGDIDAHTILVQNVQTYTLLDPPTD